MISRVIALHIKPESGVILPVEELKAIKEEGFEGDVCRGRSQRQALLISTEDLDQFDYAPGQLREQITVDLKGLQQLAIGSHIMIGSVLFEVTLNCKPCDRMAERLGEDPETFKKKMDGRRGMLCRVLSDGAIRVCDEVKIVDNT